MFYFENSGWVLIFGQSKDFYTELLIKTNENEVQRKLAG